MIPTLIILFATILFFVAERIFPGRELPEATGWYARAAFLNLAQLGVVLLAGVLWNRWLQHFSLFHIAESMPAFLQGLLGWFVGTFFFYWWHRARHHVDVFWRVFHQVHHSPARIEMLTSFYKHPVEIIADSILASALMYCLLGASAEGAAWFNVYAVIGEYFYHSNLRTPHWIGYFLQRPQASLDPSPARCAPVQLWRHHLVGSHLRHLPRHGWIRTRLRFPGEPRSRSWTYDRIP